jgi:Domain of unknown function (DUF4166)
MFILKEKITDRFVARVSENSARAGNELGAPRVTPPARTNPIKVLNMARAPEIDTRFQVLLGNANWAKLPDTIRARFGRKARAGCTVSYVGQIAECEMTALGKALAIAAKLIGGPLPLSADTNVAAAVNVTEDEVGEGQFWTRQYGHHKGFPQTINSVKRFGGPTGIEEHLGVGFLGVGIALTLRAESDALYFESDHYFVNCFGLRIKMPTWLSPGHLVIGHIDGPNGWFAFTLDLKHPRWGTLIHQVCMFAERSEVVA